MFITSERSILIVDDDYSILRVLKLIFQKQGYTVSVAEKGSEAIEKIKSTRYDVALIDFCLPDMEGSELFPLIKQASPNTIKVMLTGKSLHDIKGADVLVGKPIQLDKLLSIIDTKLKDQNIES